MRLSPKGLSAPVKVLLLNNMGFNIGFYMLLPYLAKHLTDGLGLTAGFVGFVMGFRMLSQQGFFLVGGSLADRFNYQGVIMAGCALRVVGFALFGFAEGPYGVLAAAFMTGFAGALFTPAYQALMARLTENHPERERIFALQNVTSQAGALLGPLVGLLFLKIGFFALSLGASAIFFGLLVLQLRYLPRMKGAEHASLSPVWRDWLDVLRQKDFVVFCFAMSAYYLMFNQLYVLLPLSVPNEESVAAIFILSAVFGVLFQIPLTAWSSRFLPRSARLGLGMGLMALSFLFLATDLGEVAAVPLAALFTVVILTLGTLVLFPPALSMVPELGQERRQGVCFGIFYLFAGIAGALGGGLTAWFWERNAHLLLGGLTSVGLFFAIFLRRVARRYDRIFI